MAYVKGTTTGGGGSSPAPRRERDRPRRRRDVVKGRTRAGVQRTPPVPRKRRDVARGEGRGPGIAASPTPVEQVPFDLPINMPEPIIPYAGPPNTIYHPMYGSPDVNFPGASFNYNRGAPSPYAGPSAYEPMQETLSPWEESIRMLFGIPIPRMRSPNTVSGIRG